jgi:hypothetical protein
VNHCLTRICFDWRPISSHNRKWLIALLAPLLFFGMVLVPPASAEEGPRGNGLSAAMESVDYLFDLLDQEGEDLDHTAIRNLLHFVHSDTESLSGKPVSGKERCTGIFYEFEIDAPMESVVDYLHHPEIPRYLFMPSSVRLWARTSASPHKVIDAWRALDGSTATHLLLRGEEFEENTPDQTTGGYYSYLNQRLLILLAHEGEKYLLSVSRQKEPSNFGRKGVVIGEDQNWNYFYSGDQGLTMNGLGWVNSTIYDSYSVSVLRQVEGSGQPRTNQKMFIWKRAGWSGLNMVKAHHIVDGCERFSQGMKSVLESPHLPPAEEMASMARRVYSLSKKDLRRSLDPYVRHLEHVSAKDPVLSRREFQELIQNGSYLSSMDREELAALLLSEQLKMRLGKPSLLAGSEHLLLAKSGQGIEP